jgi:MFS family permease
VAGTAAIEPSATDAALAEPTRDVNWVFLVSITLANLGIMMVLITPLNNLLPRYTQAITGGDGKEAALAVVSGVGAIAAMVFNPLAGALSDRTTARIGRRRPWIIGGALMAAALMVVMSYQTSIVGLTILWFLVLAAANMAFSALTAYIPDRVPVHQRGLISGFVGLATVVGIVGGVSLVSFAVKDLRQGTWLVAGVMVLLLIPMVVAIPDARLPRSALVPFRWSAFFAKFWVSPRKHPDFGWAWITRFLVWMGTALATIYLLFYLEDYLRYPDPAAGQATLILLYGVGTALTAVVGGKLSDRSGKRKIYVIVSSIVMGLSVLILAFVPSFAAACVGAFLLGTGYGVYLAVDQALITQVLPAAEDRARDLGVINIANTAPQILAPVLAAPLVTGLGYPALFIATAIVMVLAGILVRFIRSVP